MKVTLNEELMKVENFMSKNGWQMKLCNNCGTTFFNKTDIDTCGWRKCSNDSYLFQSFSKKKKIINPAQINYKIANYFNSAGFQFTEPENIVNLRGQTDLIVAGVQIFDNVIHHNHPVEKEKLFIAQPCIRT